MKARLGCPLIGHNLGAEATQGGECELVPGPKLKARVQTPSQAVIPSIAPPPETVNQPQTLLDLESPPPQVNIPLSPVSTFINLLLCFLFFLEK